MDYLSSCLSLCSSVRLNVDTWKREIILGKCHVMSFLCRSYPILWSLSHSHSSSTDDIGSCPHLSKVELNRERTKGKTGLRHAHFMTSLAWSSATPWVTGDKDWTQTRCTRTERRNTVIARGWERRMFTKVLFFHARGHKFTSSACAMTACLRAQQKWQISFCDRIQSLVECFIGNYSKTCSWSSMAVS